MSFLLREIALDRDVTAAERRESVVFSVTKRMTQFVSTLHGSALAARRRKANSGPPSARQPVPHPVATPAGAVTPAMRRTRAAAVTASDSSPRRGAKKKQQRLAAARTADVVSRWTLPASIDGCSGPELTSSSCHSPFRSTGRPTTEFVGWRRLHLEEVVRLEKGDPFILVVPASRRLSKDGLQSVKHLALEQELRLDFVKRLSTHVCGATTGIGARGAYPHLEQYYSVQRNGGTYVELPCQVVAYPERDDFLLETCSKSDLRRLIGPGGAGLRVKLLDFPSTASLLIKFREVPALQLWTEHFRGEPRQCVHLTHKKVTVNYCDALERLYDDVKDDYM